MADTYLLLKGGLIIGAGSKKDWVPEADQSLQTLTDVALEDFFKRFSLSTDKTTITANGADEATITVTTNMQVASLAVRFQALDDVGEALGSPDVVNVTITNGTGTEALTCDNPCRVLITPDDQSLYVGSLMIEAV